MDWISNIRNTVQLAKDMGLGIGAVEDILNRIEDYGYITVTNGILLLKVYPNTKVLSRNLKSFTIAWIPSKAKTHSVQIFKTGKLIYKCMKMTFPFWAKTLSLRLSSRPFPAAKPVILSYSIFLTADCPATGES